MKEKKKEECCRDVRLFNLERLVMSTSNCIYKSVYVDEVARRFQKFTTQ